MLFKWTKYFYYDESSPTCLRWAVERRTGRYYNVILVEADSVAGHTTSEKSPQVKLHGKMYLVHRIIWELHNGEIPDNLCVDHIDGNPLNNAIHNLRLVTRTVNGRNQKKFSTNRSGVTGVSWDEQNSRWLAQWKDRQGVAKKKSFSAKKYGYDEALEAAKLYREQIISTLNSEGAGYTQRHGT